jgi:translation initiation factor IF-2
MQGGRPGFQRGVGGGQFRSGGADDRRQGGQRQRSGLETQKTGMFSSKSDEFTSTKNEQKREFLSRDSDKEVKKDLKRETTKTAPIAKSQSRKFRPATTIIGEKKGVHEVLDDEFILNEFYTAPDDLKRGRRQQRQRKFLRKEKFIPPRAVLTSVRLPEAMTVKELAETLKKTAGDVIKRLINMGMAATLNEVLDFDTATLVAGEFGISAEKSVVINEEDILFDDSDADETELEPRAPVVVVMGHVDHGKTSLLDAIRKTNVISSEAGGITQHIGAYMVNVNGKAITFLDTPGHEAFTSMRARGAMVTDVAILVVAADDGVMPQTVEAINHAKAAKVSIIVAINKIDKDGANPDRVKQELTEHDLVVEEWGGDVIAVPVSAKTGENIEQLLEMVLLTADVLELKASRKRQAKGTVIEAKLDKSRGPVATLLIQRGTLNVGDAFITGSTIGRIRAMLDDKGDQIKSAGPSTPVEIIGLSEVPEAGEVFYVTTDDKVTKSLAEKRRQTQREEQLKATSRVTLEDLFSQIQQGDVKELNLIIKADVQGSVEAVRQSLEKLGNDEVRINIIHGGVGAINESDVSLADVSNAIIIGFNVRPGGAAVIDAAEGAGVDMRLYTVIYNAIEDIQSAMKGMLDPTYREVVLGHVEVRQIFKASGIGTIGGCYVLDGKIQRGNSIRIIRNGTPVHEGKLASLKRFKDDAREVLQGFECGISIERFNDIKENDVIEPYTMEVVPVE